MLDILTDMEVDKLKDRVSVLERQVDVLKKYIKDKFDVDIDSGVSSEQSEDEKGEEVLTPKEMAEWEQYISSIEERSYIFDYYGRKERMAESSKV